jgi:hypothetical protein
MEGAYFVFILLVISDSLQRSNKCTAVAEEMWYIGSAVACWFV